MLYYGDREHELDTPASLARIASVMDECSLDLTVSGPDSLVRIHPLLVGAVISLGEIHQAVADLRFPEEDDVLPETDSLMRTGVRFGECVYASHLALRSMVRSVQVDHLVSLIYQARAGIQALSRLSLPATLAARIPEGFAFYSLYPEMYFESLQRVLAEMPSTKGYFVIGLRSIGTSLAALVAGALEEMGLAAQAVTIRPRGHPFDRHVNLGVALHTRLSEARDETFLIVDEGPGLTCSSFLSVVHCLEDLGISPERIAILSAWQGAPSVYASDELRSRWKSQRVFYTDTAAAFDGWRSLLPFVDESLTHSRDRVSESWKIDDLSYGQWRDVCCLSVDSWPVIHRPAERTKLLLTSGQAAESGIRTSGGHAEETEGHDRGRQAAVSTPTRRVLAKFAGLGDYGMEKLDRARALSQAGFIPPVRSLAYGFILSDFVDGSPLGPADLCLDLMERMASYYAFVSRTFRVAAAPRFEQLSEVILYNSRRGLDVDATPFVDDWRMRRDEIDSLSLARLDGRPFPHEWIDTRADGPERYLKADAYDHFLDHTLVGEQSILWDLAGTCEEWEMSPSQVEGIMSAWRRKSDEAALPDLLEFFRAAYLSFRAAALHYAIHSTDEEQIRRQLQHQEFMIHQRLRGILVAHNDSMPLSTSCTSRE